ncbi:MAG: phytanoyl-CoA dioxygenase family protein [Candidatus Sumerlaeaceae bacterium]
MPITDKQRYLFDLNGFIVLENLLDSSTIELLTNLVTENYQPPAKLTQENAYSSFLHWGEPVLDLLVHPQIVEWATELCGPRPRLDHAYFYYMRKSEPEALGLHGGGTNVNHSEYFYFKNGAMHNGLIVVAWALQDTAPGDGGFCCIPGSHKANYNYHSIYGSTDYSPPVLQVPVKAGSVVIFTEALTHGTMTWQAEHDRRTFFYKYCPSAGVWARWDESVWDAPRKNVPAGWPQEKRHLAEQLFAPPCISNENY